MVFELYKVKDAKTKPLKTWEFVGSYQTVKPISAVRLESDWLDGL
jgi:hypothetical protein